MMRDEVFWNRVNVALDERRDPLADARVQDELAERPERLDELLRVTARVNRLPPRRLPAHRGPIWNWIGVAAAVAAGVLALVRWRAESDEPPVSSTSLAAAELGEVVDFELVVTRTEPGGRSYSVVDRDHVLSTHESELPEQPRSTLTTQISRPTGSTP